MSESPHTPLRILIVGAHGTMGSRVARELSKYHEVISAGRSQGDILLDITDTDSIQAGLRQAGPLDALVCCAGHLKFEPLAHIEAAPVDASAYTLGLQSKLMGQVNLALAARGQLRDGGSITLTSGILNRQFIRGGSSAAMANAALEGFVQAAALEMPRGIRLNAVSSTLITESIDRYGPLFPGFETVPAQRVALAFRRSVEGIQSGHVFVVGS